MNGSILQGLMKMYPEIPPDELLQMPELSQLEWARLRGVDENYRRLADAINEATGRKETDCDQLVEAVAGLAGKEQKNAV